MMRLPNREVMRKIIHRKRRKLCQVPDNPRTINELELPREFMMYKPTPDTEERFCLMDRGMGHERIIIFGRETWLEHMKTAKIWYVDGTFSIAPNLFYQIYIIMIRKYNGVHPILYVLLQNKQSATYRRMMNMLQDMVPSAQPEVINCDFEHAAFNTMKECFPNVEKRGCLFHLSQNILKKMKNMGFMVNYRDDADFALDVKMITAIAFVPINDIDAHVESLAHYLPAELIPLLDWFEDNYIGHPNRRGPGRSSPLFPINMWNMYVRTQAGDDRTNNHAEAANRRLKRELGMMNPTIWKFISALKRVQKGRDEHFEKLLAGNEPQSKLLKYRQADQRIMRNEVEYLRAIAHNLS